MLYQKEMEKMEVYKKGDKKLVYDDSNFVVVTVPVQDIVAK